MQDKKAEGSDTLGSSQKIYAKGSFGYDREFLRALQDDLVVLGEDSTGPQVLISPDYQGRVMTSTAEGDAGTSFGWINYDLIASGKTVEHINPVGGEERFWLGPEGGQYSLYFKKGSPFIFDHWFVPKELDTEPFKLVSSNEKEASFEKEMQLENYSGTLLSLKVNRTIRLLDKQAIGNVLGIDLPQEVSYVGFESENIVTNTGKEAWTKKTGLLSIWILSMLNGSEATTVAIPFNKQESGSVVTDDYFGKVPADRLKVGDGLILFKADAAYRSKIGLSPRRALPLAASYDAEKSVLTLAQFSLPAGESDYVNSLWKLQDDPYSGDAVNAYNDGPIDGKQMGKFYELESSSPAAALAPGMSKSHTHRTIHIKGTREQLSSITRKLLGIDVDGLHL
jgi:hypothetical protein